MAEWKELVLKGGSIADVGMVGAAQGDLLVAGSTPFTFAALTKGAAGKVLEAGASTLTWETPTPKVGTAQGALLVAGSTPFAFAELAKGTSGHVLTAGATTISWTAAGSGDFKADGSVAMTDALKLVSNAGEGGMTTTDGAIFFDTTADKVKVYVA